MPKTSANHPVGDTLSISGWTVEVSAHRISKTGETFRLEPRTMAVLAFLAGRPGQAVTREDLEREVWQGTVVGYDALSNAVVKLRKAFGDDPKKPQIIETIPKVGYRLIAPVSVLETTTVVPTIDRSLVRKLTAILYADVVGYSRLTGMDEDGTHRTLRTRLDLITTTVEEYNGHVVHFAGDAVLADLPTVSDAVACAISVQQAIAIEDEDVAPGRQLQFRIGVNLGEVIVDRDDIYGDGVNIAARLEALAEPGGVCLSGTVYDAIGHNLPLDYEFLGEQTVKNIAKPVRAYHARMRPGMELPGPTATGRVSGHWQRHLLFALAGGVAVAVIIAGVTLLPTGIPETVPVEPAAEIGAETLPAVAVLPFKNLSGDPEQDFFADGMTTNLITDLSKISGITVIARHSVFSYQDASPSLDELAAALGVRYVVQGTVQRAGGRMRISAGLVDTNNGTQLWAERFDRPELDVFALQDEVTTGIVTALAIQLTGTELSRIARKGTRNLEAYDLYLRAENMRINPNPRPGDEGPTRARNPLPLYREAIALDAQYVDAYAGIARTAVDVWEYNTTDLMPPAAARRMAYEAASQVLELDDQDPRAYATLALIQVMDGEHDQSLASARQSIDLAPGDADSHVTLAHVLVFAGRHDEARAAMDRAFRLNPVPPLPYYGELGTVLFFQRDYEGALTALRKATHSDSHIAMLRAMVYAELGRADEAAADLEALFLATPFANLAYYRTTLAHFRREEDLEHYLGALSKAGVPAWPYGYQPVPDDKLDAQSVEAIVAGHTWSGLDSGGGPFIQQFTDDGRVAFRNRETLRTGTVQVRESMLCVRYPAALLGREDCGYLYRNPKGSHEAKNEYVQVALGQIYYFSLAR